MSTTTSLLEGQSYFGLFELDDAGTVLYARIEPDDNPAPEPPDVTGHDFFSEVAPFENGEEFRRRVAAFTRGQVEADSFVFNCRVRGDALPVRVLLTRIRHRADGNRMKSTLLHIRRP